MNHKVQRWGMGATPGEQINVDPNANNLDVITKWEFMKHHHQADAKKIVSAV